MLYDPSQKDPYPWPGFHDPLNKRFIGITFRPAPWVASTVYGRRNKDDYDVLIPTVFTGFYYKVINPGKSLLVEPTYVAEEGEETLQTGTSLVLEAVAYNLLPLTENVSAVTYSCTHGVTVSSSSFTAIDCRFMIDPLPAEAIAAKSFIITALVTKSNGEEFPVPLEFKVK